jgi:Ca-activated chloride channel homolog
MPYLAGISAHYVHLYITQGWVVGFAGPGGLGSGMKYTKLYIFLVTMALVMATLPASAQSNFLPSEGPYTAGPTAASTVSPVAAPETDAESDSVLTIKKRVDEVHVVFIATDKHGKFVRDLNQDDFTILDDHKPPQAISNFRRETDLPLNLGLLVDMSGSVRGRFDFEQEAATFFLQKTVRANFDKAFVMGFNSQSQVTQDFTDDPVLLASGVQKLHAGGGTALYDAVYQACKQKLAKQEADRPVRRAIVVVSDGEDNQSDVSLSQAIEMAQRSEVIIYAISTDDSGLVLRGDKVLEQLADATGGRAFFPFKMKDIKSSFAAIEDELRSQYVVSYQPADFMANGQYRPVEITALKKDLQVRARKGYYAPRQ